MAAHIKLTAPVLADCIRLGEQIRAERKARKLSRYAVAALANTRPQSVDAVERGEAQTGFGLYVSICSVLGVDLQLAVRLGPQAKGGDHIASKRKRARRARDVHGDERTGA